MAWKLRARLTYASVVLIAVLLVGALAAHAVTVSGGSAARGLPEPVLGEQVNLLSVSGTVSILLPGAQDFVPLTEPRQVPIRTDIDTSEGRVRLVSADGERGGTHWARVSRGLFEVRQSGNPRKRGLTVLRLKGGPSKAECDQAHPAAVPRRRILRVRSQGGHRSYTSGVAGTVRGTAWTVTDSCGLVDTEVSSGAVLVENLTKPRVVRQLVTAGGRFRTRGRYSAATIRGG